MIFVFFQKNNAFVCVLLLYISISSVRLQYSGRCLDNTVSFYPKCNCDAENEGFNGFQCEAMCPSISDGVYPNCTCRYGKTYDGTKNSCPEPTCPLNTTRDSFFPKCKCAGENYEYSEYLNECYLVCPENSTGSYPNCRCNDDGSGFNNGN